MTEGCACRRLKRDGVLSASKQTRGKACTGVPCVPSAWVDAGRTNMYLRRWRISMRVNTSTSMRLARRVKSRYGTWQAVRQASRVENGVYVVSANAAADSDKQDGSIPVTA